MTEGDKKPGTESAPFGGSGSKGFYDYVKRWVPFWNSPLDRDSFYASSVVELV